MDFKTLSLLTAILLAATTISNVSNNEFAEFKARHGKNYSTEEETMRLAIFNQNVAKINAHNSANNSYKMGINQFTDMTQEEFESVVLMPKWYAPEQVGVKSVGNVDWVSQGAVTGVKDQGRVDHAGLLPLLHLLNHSNGSNKVLLDFSLTNKLLIVTDYPN